MTQGLVVMQDDLVALNAFTGGHSVWIFNRVSSETVITLVKGSTQLF